MPIPLSLTEKTQALPSVVARYRDTGWLFASELDGVVDEAGEDVGDLSGVAVYFRKKIVGHLGLILLDTGWIMAIAPARIALASNIREG